MNFLAYLCLPCPQMSQMKKRRVGRWWEKSESWGWFICGWEEGAIWHWMRGKCMGCWVRYLFLFNITQPFLFWLCSPYSTVKSDMSDHISLSPFRVGFVKKGECVEGGGAVARGRGLGKIQSAVAGLEAESLYGLLWGAMSCSPMSSVPPPPKNAANPHLPPSPHHSCKNTRKQHLKLLPLQWKNQGWHWKSPLQLHQRL